MAATVDITTEFTSLVGELRDAIIQRAEQHAALADLGFAPRHNVTTRTETLKVSLNSKITRKRTTHGTATNKGALTITPRYLDPVNVHIEDEYNSLQFQGLISKLMLKLGMQIGDLTDTDIDTLVTELYAEVWGRDKRSLVLNGDDTLNPLAGDTEAFYSSIKGIWQHIYAGVALGGGDPDKVARVNINAIQGAAMAAGYMKATLLPNMYKAQVERMKAMPDENKVFVVTDHMYDNYVDSLEGNAALESSWATMQNGTKAPKFKGIPVVKAALLDVATTDLTLTNRHRAYLTVQGNLEVGDDTDTPSAVAKFFYTEKQDVNTMRIQYQLCCNYSEGDLLIAAY